MRSHHRVIEPPSPDFVRTRVDHVEISRPLPQLVPVEVQTGVSYGSSRCLISLHGRPLGLISFDLRHAGISADALAERIDLELGDAIGQHLRDDGLPLVKLTAAGLSGSDHPRCVHARDELLQDPPTASVVVITLGRPERARETVRSILSGSYPADRYEVIIVETPSEPGARLEISETDFGQGPQVRVIRGPRPGVSIARNTGLSEAGGEFVAFADDDVDTDPNWLATLMTAFRRSDHVGASSGMTLPAAFATASQRWYEGYGDLQRGFETRVYDLHQPPPDRPLFPFTVGDYGSGCSMAVRRNLFQQLGGFDVALGPGTPTLAGEDIEALLRIVLSGWKLVREPAAITWHDHPSSYSALRRRMWGYGVGLTACFIKAVTHHPDHLRSLVRKLPRGLAFALSPSSDKNKKRQPDYPHELVRLELAGMAYGPAAYSLSRWQQRRRRG